ncbi:acyltransferase family protein [Francisella philomiragia]|uniref:acyltransferase family protein n=1 Tax=Francisella philomiragia TaxID=28110 RepID=UPI001905AAEF|nr:acyltransferase family protein [Francisella philomiragia]MBK2296102.1 acyltransferase [Francisella philomiragia]MBK2340015.1 acyltransferase [Francisella philomiragia]
MKYYKHIDGLRAVAVLSVVFFHLDINLVKSGFLGVDIFFVISGFLITSIIIRDLESKSFSLKNFYLRRMRRILPALITVLIFSTVFAWLILLPQDLKNYSKSLVSALGSFSNLYFFKTLSFGYFSTDATVIPLLHTWSLGIEEQFYIFWPLFLIFAFNVYIGIGWKDKQALSNFDKYLIISLILIVLSLFCFRYFSYFEIYDYFNHERFYYFPLTRAFELLFGCALAIYLTKYKPTNNKLILELLSIISILLMLYPVLFKDVSYPSNWTVIACVGAVLYIYAGCNERYNTLVNRFLSIKPIVFIGLISYSLYLWHWPIIAYLNYLSIEKTHLVKLVILALSVVLATLTYLFVEKPFRYKFKASFKKTLILLWIIPIAIASCFALGSKYISNFGFNYNTFKLVSPSEYNCYPIDEKWNIDKHILSNCKRFGDLSKREDSIVLYGDSHAQQLGGFIDALAKNASLKAVEITTYKRFTLYSKHTQNIINNIYKELNPKYIVFGGLWILVTKDRENSIVYLEDAIRTCIKDGIIPVLVLDNPPLYNLSPNCGGSRIKKVLLIEDNCFVQKQKVLNTQRKSLHALNTIIKKYPQIKVIDTKKITCRKSKCYSILSGQPLYYNHILPVKGDGPYANVDNSHFNLNGSKLIGEMYLKEYGNPLKSS